MESDNRFLTIGDTCRIANCPKEKIQRLISEGQIPPSCIHTVEGVTLLHKGIATTLKNQKSSWFTDEQPANVVHVEDPDGVYPGFCLEPEAAMRLAEIRVTKRLTGRMANGIQATLGILQDERGRCRKNR